MKIKRIGLTAIYILFASLCSLIRAESIPSDVTPFVQLGRLVKLSIYKDPVIEKETGKILSNGKLIDEKVVQMPVGSGSIISVDGLILTNYHIYQMKDEYRYDSEKRILYAAFPATETMSVYVLKDNDPLKVPELQYLAVPISLDEYHDTAILKIVSYPDGTKLQNNNFAYVHLGNPFSMKLNENLTIIGYPAKGGKTITITDGKFLGYYRDENYYGIDGFIKTNAAMAPGNSGGAAMNKKKLIGVPTAVTLPTMAGSDMGYIHPITWTLKGLIIAKQKYGFAPPKIPIEWLRSDYNTDETANNVYITGNVISAHSHSPLFAEIVITRPDRTFEEIEKLHKELQSILIIYFVQNLNNLGLSAQEIAEELELAENEIQRVLAMELSEENISQNAMQHLRGEFFYQNTQSDSEGFFILSIPRRSKFRLYVLKDGFRSVIKDITTGNGDSQSLGRIKLYEY